jgi:hypothetical protein
MSPPTAPHIVASEVLNGRSHQQQELWRRTSWWPARGPPGDSWAQTWRVCVVVVVIGVVLCFSVCQQQPASGERARQKSSALSVGEYDGLHILLRPVGDDIRHAPGLADGEVETARRAEDVTEGQTGVTDRWSVHDRELNCQKARLHVVCQHPTTHVMLSRKKDRATNDNCEHTKQQAHCEQARVQHSTTPTSSGQPMLTSHAAALSCELASTTACA